MDSVLIVSNTSTTLQIISSLLGSQKFSRVSTIQNGAQARRDLLDAQYDLIIIDAPLPDELGDDLALHAAESTDAGIILIVSSEILDDVNANVEDAGVFVLPKPISPEFFYQAAKLLTASRKRVKRHEDANKKLQQKMSEVRIVDRAKCILIQHLEMTERQAHHYIEKQSMDLRQSRIVTAQNILKTYDL